MRGRSCWAAWPPLHARSHKHPSPREAPMEELSTPSETSQLQPLKQAPLLPVFVVVDHPFLETGLRILWPGGSASGENTVGVGSSLNKLHGLQEYEPGAAGQRCPYVHNQKWPQPNCCISSNQRSGMILHSGARRSSPRP